MVIIAVRRRRNVHLHLRYVEPSHRLQKRGTTAIQPGQPNEALHWSVRRSVGIDSPEGTKTCYGRPVNTMSFLGLFQPTRKSLPDVMWTPCLPRLRTNSHAGRTVNHKRKETHGESSEAPPASRVPSHWFCFNRAIDQSDSSAPRRDVPEKLGQLLVGEIHRAEATEKSNRSDTDDSDPLESGLHRRTAHARRPGSWE